MHTHVYSRYVGQTTETVIKGTTGDCPSGHPDCILTPTGSTEILCFAMSDDDANTTASKLLLHHTHKYYKMTVLETASVEHVGGGNNCPLGHPGCDDFNSPITVPNYPTLVLEVEEETSDAIWDSEIEHHHTFLWCEDMSISFWWVGTTTCPLGHSNCKRITVNGVSGSRDAPDNTPLGEIEGYSTGYWYIFPTSTLIENPVYCGFEYWKDEDHKSEMWYNPPGGTTEVPLNVADPTVTTGEATYINTTWCLLSGAVETPEFNYKANIGGLQPGTTYYWRAMVQEKLGGESRYYGDTKNFTTLSAPPPIPPIFGLGNDYRSAKQAIKNVADISLGRSYVDNEGNVQYESRFRRQV